MQTNKPLFLKVFLVCLYLLSSFPVLSHGAKIPPEQKLETVRTPHFRVHYPKTHQTFAAYLVAYLEEAYGVLSQDLAWNVQGKIDVVIRSDTDIPNGYASVFPFNRLTIHAVPFYATSFIGEYDNWIRTLAYHELTHIIANDTTTGAFETLRSIFGSAAKINPYQPQWLIEGLAVYYETLRSTYGRGRSTLVDMILRTAARHDLLQVDEPRSRKRLYLDTRDAGDSSSEQQTDLRLLKISIDRLNDGSPVWPHFQTPYIYGYLMNEMMADLGDDTTPAKVSKKNSSRIPFFINVAIERTLGKTYEDIWSKGVGRIRSQSQRDLDEINAQGSTEVEKLTEVGRFSSGPVLSKKSGHLFFVRDSYTDGAGLSEYSLVDRKIKTLSHWRWAGGTRLKLSPQEDEIIYSRMVPFQEFKMFSDIFIWNRKTKTETQLTFGLRAAEPDVSPDFLWDANQNKIIRGKIVYIKNLEDANQALAIYDGQKESILFKGEKFQRLSFPSWGRGVSADRVLFSIKQNGGTERLQVVQVSNLETKSVTPFLDPRSRIHENQVSWEQDGSILFSSSLAGVYNVHEIKASALEGFFNKTSKTFPLSTRITNLETGAFFPIEAAHPDYLYAMVYGPSGFDLSLVKRGEFNTGNGALPTLREKIRGDRVPETVIPDQAVTSDWLHSDDDYTVGVAESYSIFPTIWPKYWFPTVRRVPAGWIYGVKTSGFDALEKNKYDAFLGGDSRARFPNYQFRYEYDGFFPTLQLEALQENRYLGLLERSNRFTSQSANFLIPAGEQSQFSLGGTFGQSRLLDQESKAGGLETQWFTSNMRSHPNSIHAEGGEVGYRLNFGLTAYFVGDENFNAVHGAWEQRVPSFFEQHFFRILTNYSASNNADLSTNYYLGGGQGSVSQNQSFLVRGYQAGSIYGRKILTVNNEYWFPLKDVFRGWGTYPLFFERTKMRAFVDTGSAEYVGTERRRLTQWPVGVGVHLLNDLNLFYRVPVTVGVGFDWGLSKELGGEKQILFGIYSRIF
jgi:hypothetical protein